MRWALVAALVEACGRWMVVLVVRGGVVAGGDGGAGEWMARRRTTTPAWPWRRPELEKEG